MNQILCMIVLFGLEHLTTDIFAHFSSHDCFCFFKLGGFCWYIGGTISFKHFSVALSVWIVIVTLRRKLWTLTRIVSGTGICLYPPFLQRSFIF